MHAKSDLKALEAGILFFVVFQQGQRKSKYYLKVIITVF